MLVLGPAGSLPRMIPKSRTFWTSYFPGKTPILRDTCERSEIKNPMIWGAATHLFTLFFVLLTRVVMVLYIGEIMLFAYFVFFSFMLKSQTFARFFLLWDLGHRDFFSIFLLIYKQHQRSRRKLHRRKLVFWGGWDFFFDAAFSVFMRS